MKKIDKSTAWINSGEFLSDIEDVRSAILRKAAYAKNESQTSKAFENELYFLIRSKTGLDINFSSETFVGGIIHNFSSLLSRKSGNGRLDAVVNNLVIEYKHHSKLKSKKNIETAVAQVSDYLLALHKTSNICYQAILTDGLKICYFSFNDDNTISATKLMCLEKNDIAIIVKAIVLNDTKKFVAGNITHDFGIRSEVSSISKELANILFSILKTSATKKTEMLYQEWLSLLHLSVEDNGKSNDIQKRQNDLSLIFNTQIDNTNLEYRALWALQTTYAIIVKLIACKVVDKLDYNPSTQSFYDLTRITSQELQKFFEKIEDGYSYRNSNVSNFLEGDFFSWYSDCYQWNEDLYKSILKIIKLVNEYSTFSFSSFYNPVDIFKDLYMSMIPKSIRHSMGEYFTPEWLADCVVSEAIKDFPLNCEWKAIDPCCGSGIFIISLIKHIVGNVDINHLTDSEKEYYKNTITSRVFGIDINPLSVLSARVGYFIALQPFGILRDVEIPIYLGDSAIIPTKIIIDNINCYRYSVTNEKMPFDIVLPERFVKNQNFGKTMNELQACVKTDDSTILYSMIVNKFTEDEKKSTKLIDTIKELAKNLIYLHKNNWDGIWVRISTNFMLIARLSEFDLIVGNPPWVKWEHLPALYANKIKELCNVKHIFSNDGGQFGGTQLNICALISNVTASNWLSPSGVLAFLMPDSIMSQNSYEEFRNFYTDYAKKSRLYLQKIDKWESPLRPFRCDDKPISQDFNTYYFSSNEIDYAKGIPVRVITKKEKVKESDLNKISSFQKVLPQLRISTKKASQLSPGSTAFSYLSQKHDYSEIIGSTSYQYRTGVEFTPQELYMLQNVGNSNKKGFHNFKNKKFALSKYIIDDMPKLGWELPTDYIYPIATSTHMNNFKFEYSNEYCIIPYNITDLTKPISSIQLLRDQPELFQYLVSHKNLIDLQSEKSKAMHRGNEFYSLSKIGSYTFAPYIVAARDNTKFCAAVIKPVRTAWGEVKQTVCVKHTIIISQNILGQFITKEEAYYISGILNSNIVIEYMHDSFKKNGFSLNKSGLYIPLFDYNNNIHIRIAQIAKKAEKLKKIAKFQNELSLLYLKICKNK